MLKKKRFFFSGPPPPEEELKPTPACVCVRALLPCGPYPREHSPIPVTYAGGARSIADLELVRGAGKGKVDITVGSALDCFGQVSLVQSHLSSNHIRVFRRSSNHIRVYSLSNLKSLKLR